MKRVFSLIVSVTILGMVSLSACSVPDSGGASSSSATSSAPEKYNGHGFENER
ncbi:MAG: hypothetical protein IKC36_01430 [Clostridia bacterium]|nr:hypothetical protein [Clostridia bacterium]